MREKKDGFARFARMVYLATLNAYVVLFQCTLLNLPVTGRPPLLTGRTLWSTPELFPPVAGFDNEVPGLDSVHARFHISICNAASDIKT